MIAPVLLLWGLRGADASAASLLLNLEGVLTTLLAALLFREAVTGRIWIATLLMAAGGVLLSWRPMGGGLPLQSLAIVGACLFWGLDNNLTRKVAASDPSAIAMIKGLAAGSLQHAARRQALGTLTLPPAQLPHCCSDSSVIRGKPGAVHPRAPAPPGQRTRTTAHFSTARSSAPAPRYCCSANRWMFCSHRRWC